MRRMYSAGSPDVRPATRRLVHDAMGHWTPARHFLFHAGVRRHVRVVVLCGNRARDRHNVPTELWRLICSFFLRADGADRSAGLFCSARLVSRHWAGRGRRCSSHSPSLPSNLLATTCADELTPSSALPAMLYRAIGGESMKGLGRPLGRERSTLQRPQAVVLCLNPAAKHRQCTDKPISPEPKQGFESVYL